MTELDSLWEAIQNSFRQDTTPVTFDTLIAPAKAISLSQNQLGNRGAHSGAPRFLAQKFKYAA